MLCDRGRLVSAAHSVLTRPNQDCAGAANSMTSPMTFDIAACPLCTAADSTHLCSLDTRLLRKEYWRTHRVRIMLADSTRIDFRRCNLCDLRYFDRAVCGDADFYRQLQRISWYYKKDKQEYAIAAGYIRSSDSVLEVGAGRAAFAQRTACQTYVGLETSPDAIAAAAAAGITLLQEDIETHSIRHAGKYDVVCAFQVLEHVANPRGFLESAKRCLRPGGRMIIAVPSEDSFAAISYWDVLNMPPHHVTRWTDRSLRYAAEILAMDVVAIQHEHLDDEHARLFAKIAGQYSIARKRSHEPRLLDPWMRRWWVRGLSEILASWMKRAFFRAELKPVGHSVVAVYQLP
jgi:SAM-dependent methyltransferase